MENKLDLINDYGVEILCYHNKMFMFKGPALSLCINNIRELMKNIYSKTKPESIEVSNLIDYCKNHQIRIFYGDGKRRLFHFGISRYNRIFLKNKVLMNTDEVESILNEIMARNKRSV